MIRSLRAWRESRYINNGVSCMFEKEKERAVEVFVNAIPSRKFDSSKKRHILTVVTFVTMYNKSVLL